MNIQAGLVAGLVGGRWRGVLITGPSGSGKSDLALRLIDQGFALVADDRTLLWTSGGRLFGRAPDTLSGLAEARGLGILPFPHRTFADIVLVVKCEPAGTVERMPQEETTAWLDVEVPLRHLVAVEPSAPAKLRHALLALG